MKRETILTEQVFPVSREKAARVAACASRYTSAIMLEGETLVINLKSMIGLLSQSAGNGQQSLQVVCDGTDEEEALAGVLEELRR